MAIDCHAADSGRLAPTEPPPPVSSREVAQYLRCEAGGQPGSPVNIWPNLREALPHLHSRLSRSAEAPQVVSASV